MRKPRQRARTMKPSESYCCLCGTLVTARNRGDTIPQRNGALARGCIKCAPIKDQK